MITQCQIKYKAGYKYQLTETAYIPTNVKPPMRVEHKWFILAIDGFMTVTEGYSWDGPSGPTFDTKDFMMPSLGHDVFYQAIRLKLLPESYRKYADKELKRWCIEKGMWRIRAEWVYWAVRCCGPDDGGKINPVLIA